MALYNNLVQIVRELTYKENGEVNFWGKIAFLIIVFIVTKIIIFIVNRSVKAAFENNMLKSSSRKTKRLKTLTSSIQHAVRIILYFIATVIVLDNFGFKTSSILATAGIGGIAVGFGAQSLIKDIISGFFMLFEDQYAVGDYVTICEKSGIIENLGIRTTELREFNGDLHIIPNGKIDMVTNSNRGLSRAWVDIQISNEQGLDKVYAIIEEKLTELKAANPNIVEGPDIVGITRLDSKGTQISIVAKTKPLEQWNAEREIRRAVKDVFEKEGISIPYDKVQLVDSSLEIKK